MCMLGRQTKLKHSQIKPMSKPDHPCTSHLSLSTGMWEKQWTKTKTQRDQGPPEVSKYTQCFKWDHLLKLKETISKSCSSTMSCSSKKFKKQCVIHGIKAKYQYKRSSRFVCVYEWRSKAQWLGYTSKGGGSLRLICRETPEEARKTIKLLIQDW